MAQGYCDKDCKKVTEGQSRGDQYQCGVCTRYTKSDIANPIKDGVQSSQSVSDNGYSAEYVVTSEERVATLEDVIRVCKIDTDVWHVDKWQVGRSEGYRKDKKSEWEVVDGKTKNGYSKDTGRILVVPLYSVRVWLSRKTEEIRNRQIVETFIEQAKKFAPKYPKISYKKSKDGMLAELALPDLQLGRLVAQNETGMAVDPQKQVDLANEVVDRLISYLPNFNISRILFPVGNDFFNSNNSEMTTAHGTPQTDDARWHRTFSLGAKLVVGIIDKLSQFAPVDVVIVPGNHDEERIWYLGEYLQAWYHKNPNVDVDNRPQKRKYYTFEKVLLGLTHGYSEKIGELGSLMAYEVPQLWAQSKYREWHLGDKHHKVDMILKTKELENGVVVRILRSLAIPSVWEFDKGLVGSLKASELFLWHPTQGLKAQFTESI